MEPPNGPPNPRQARHRRLQVSPWSGYPLSVAIIVICCAVSLLSQLGTNTRPVSWMFYNQQEQLELIDHLQMLQDSDEPDLQAIEELTRQLDEAGPPKPPLHNIAQGQVWRVITPIFLHFGVMHLAFNMLWVWTLGRILEPMLGRLRFTLLILLIAVVSNTAEALIGGTSFGGMSGVVYGLFGYLVLLGRLDPSVPRIDSGTIFYMMVWMVLCFTPFIGNIANWCHSFGLATGAIMGTIQGLRHGGLERIKRRREFHSAIQESTTGALHECCVCRKTEHHDSDLEFRVGRDGREYCMEHLPEVD